MIAVCSRYRGAFIDKVVGDCDVAPGAVVIVNTRTVTRAHRGWRRWKWRLRERRIRRIRNPAGGWHALHLRRQLSNVAVVP
jgi:hypothetical protein